MNAKDPSQARFNLIREMSETVDLVRRFNSHQADETADRLAQVGRLLLTGEGSSRIFPAKNAIRKSLAWGLDLQVATEGARQAALYDLRKFAVFAASNSGRTSEVVSLLKQLQAAGHRDLYGLSANHDTLLATAASRTWVLQCGWEKAVAATKSVFEQALFYQSLISRIARRDMATDLKGLPEKIETALTMPLDPAVVQAAVRAPTVYFAGFNDGVAEELTLKTNEITRKKSDFLEGTYAVHGIEEVMNPEDLVVVIEPLEEEIAKFSQVLRDGVGLTLVAISSRPTPWPTILVPDAGEMNPYVFLAAGWNLLIAVGLALGINLDAAKRARKIGNEFAPR